MQLKGITPQAGVWESKADVLENRDCVTELPEVTRIIHISKSEVYKFQRICILGSKKKKSVHFVFGDFPLPIMLNVHVFGTKIKIRTCTL